jgi:hypothetical protein
MKVLLAASFMLTASHAGPVGAQVVPIVGTLATGAVIDKLEQGFNEALNTYQAEKNLLLAELMKESLDLLDTWKATNVSLINTAFDKLDASTQKAFNDMNALLQDVKGAETTTVHDVKDITAQWAQIVASVPLVNAAPTILDYGPRVVVPLGADEVAVKVSGPNMAYADANLVLPDGSQMPLTSSTAMLLTSIVKRGAFKTDASKASYQTLQITYNHANITGPFGFWGHWFPERQMASLNVWVLPQHVATYELTSKVHHDKVTYDTFDISIGGSGKDKPVLIGVNIPAPKHDAGWRIDTDNIGKLKVADLGGDHGSCAGIWDGTLSANGFEYNLQMGHVTRWDGKHDAHQGCKLTVPIVLHEDEVIDGPPSSGTFDWGAELPIDLPDQLASYEMNVVFFDGTSQVATGERELTYGRLHQDGAKLVFQPEVPKDF